MTSSADPRRRRVAGARRPRPVVERSVVGRPVVERPVVERPVVERPGRKRPLLRRPALGRHPAHHPAAPGETLQSAGHPQRPRLWPALTAAALAVAALAALLAFALPARLTDADRAAAVASARTTLESLLSYRGADFDAHVAQVTPQLTSPFREQFATVATSDIKPMAVKNAATVQAKVYEAGVMDSTGDGAGGSTVRVLAFINQATTTAAQKAPAIDQNRVLATMRKVGDRWLVSDLSAF
ncbi:hypothetical protein ACWEOW_10670 [Monashia sp. NPDC004114]